MVTEEFPPRHQCETSIKQIMSTTEGIGALASLLSSIKSFQYLYILIVKYFKFISACLSGKISLNLVAGVNFIAMRSLMF